LRARVYETVAAPDGEVRGVLVFKEVVAAQVEARAKITGGEALFSQDLLRTLRLGSRMSLPTADGFW
jgi:hypothetical protein